MTPAHALPLLLLLAATPWKEIDFGTKKILVDPRCERLPTDLLGPFVKRGDGAILAAGPKDASISHDNGRTWRPRPLFREPDRFESRGEAAILRTRDGTILFAFLNAKEQKLSWDQKKGGPQPDCQLPVYVIRSLDEGETWQEPQRLQTGWSGAIRQMIQLRSGRIVLISQQAVRDPGRHVSFAYVSDDEGQNWEKGDVVDLGEYGGYGDHGGGIEGTITELADGRLWLLLRTYRGSFTEAFSKDGGLTWENIRPSKILASGSPGLLQRLHDGRLLLLWNRYIDPEKRTGRREQLSMALSEDDGATWGEPAVIAYDPMKPGDKEPQHRLSYPYLYEHVPGEFWITTMQGPLRVALHERDFSAPRLSETTYRARFLPKAQIKIDGNPDEPDWGQAEALRAFRFPWNPDPVPSTEFRAICDADHLYFAFDVDDADIVALDDFTDEADAVLEDRAELYIALDDQMTRYFCVEIDSRGRPFDYSASYYRQFVRKWKFDGLATAAHVRQGGYNVEGSIPLKSLEALGFPPLKPGARIRWGIFRAEFSHDRSGKSAPAKPSIHNLGRRMKDPPPIERWMSWVDPRTTEPDFHVPTSLGWLEVAE
ncbi:MAG TPA: exo-alpha-sialidase [Verrucomicrobiae bacterium]|nr:exo-alpha-sialidase [Verrucomicrobiae bacterium]